MPIILTWKFVVAFILGLGVGSLSAGILLYAVFAAHRLYATHKQRASKVHSERRLHEALTAANLGFAVRGPRFDGSDPCCICLVRARVLSAGLCCEQRKECTSGSPTSHPRVSVSCPRDAVVGWRREMNVSNRASDALRPAKLRPTEPTDCVCRGPRRISTATARCRFSPAATFSTRSVFSSGLPPDRMRPGAVPPAPSASNRWSAA